MNYGIYSILPSLAAIILALVTKNVFIALFIALLLGNFILNPNVVGVLVSTKDMKMCIRDRYMVIIQQGNYSRKR